MWLSPSWLQGTDWSKMGHQSRHFNHPNIVKNHVRPPENPLTTSSIYVESGIMHRVLQTPELFSLIFHFLNAYDLLNCALCCRFWRDEALGLQWKVGPVKLVSAMKRLAPVTQTLLRRRPVFVRYKKRNEIFSILISSLA